jgi:hypothetical protein
MLIKKTFILHNHTSKYADQQKMTSYSTAHHFKLLEAIK